MEKNDKIVSILYKIVLLKILNNDHDAIFNEENKKNSKSFLFNVEPYTYCLIKSTKKKI